MGDDTVGAWALLVIAIMGLVGMEVVGRWQAGRILEGLATWQDMSGHFLCAWWEHDDQTDAVSNLCVAE